MEKEMVSDETLQRMITLLRDPLFCSLRRLVDEHPLPWSEASKMQTPDSLTQEQTWELLNTLRRQTATELPFRDGEGRCGWYSPTHSILSDLDNIDRRCHENSWLDLTIKSRNTTHFLIEAHVDDAITTVREDGLRIGYEKAREVLLGEREPENLEELLLLNGHQALWDLEQYVDRPCTPELIFELYEKVSRGIENRAPLLPPQKSRLWKKTCLDSTTALTLISKIINQNEGVTYTGHPLLLAMAVRHLFMSAFPLPAWNGVMSSLIMKLLFKKSHLPVLAFVPIIKACQEWENGTIHPPTVMASVLDSEVLTNNEVDYTIYVGVVTQLVKHKLDEVEAELKRVIKRDESFSRALRENIAINHRQRAVLQLAFSNPEAVFRIEPHQKTHQVAYATARADLINLADRGFLLCIRKKRAFEFHAAPGLRQLLMDQASNTSRKDAFNHHASPQKRH